MPPAKQRQMIGADVLKQRLKHLMTSNSGKDLAIFVSLLDKHGAGDFSAEPVR